MVESYGDAGGESLETACDEGSEFWRLNILRNLLVLASSAQST